MNSAIRYKVTVVAVVERTEMAQEWAKTTAEANSPMGWTPEVRKTHLKEITAYEQTFDKLDLPTVVAVLNGLTPDGYKKV